MKQLNQFWSRALEFPKDFGGFRFLGRAVNQVGRAKFGDEWTGLEGSPPELLTPKVDLGGSGGALIPSAGTAYPWQKLNIDRLLRKRRPDFGRPEPVRGRFGIKVAEFTEEQWYAGLKLAQEADKASMVIRNRFATVTGTLVDALREGSLNSALRPVKGGAYSPVLPPSMWNAESFRERFRLCQMNDSDPFGIGIAGDRFQLIFVDIQGLDALAEIASISVRVKLRQASQQTYDDAMKLLPEWKATVSRITRTAFEAHCASQGIPSSSAREAYKKLQRKPGKQAAQ